MKLIATVLLLLGSTLAHVPVYVGDLKINDELPEMPAVVQDEIFEREAVAEEIMPEGRANGRFF